MEGGGTTRKLQPGKVQRGRRRRMWEGKGFATEPCSLFLAAILLYADIRDRECTVGHRRVIFSF